MEELIFNVHDWLCEDSPVEDDDEVPTYVIKMFGRMLDGRTASVTITGFPPHFYISVPFEFQDRHIRELTDLIRRKCPQGFKGCKPVMRKDVWGFQNEQSKHFVQLLFLNHASMRKASYIFNKTIRLQTVGRIHDYKLYESNVEPFVRFCHKQNIRPSGWVRVEKWRPNMGEYKSSSDVDALAKWGDVVGHAMDRIAPFLIASFDIECTSFDGEFPIAIRDLSSSQLRSETEVRERVDNWCANVVRSSIEDGAKDAAGIEAAILLRIDEGKIRFKGVPPAPGVISAALAQVEISPSDASARLITQRILSKMPGLQGDPIIMIGLVMNTYGDRDQRLEKHIYVAAPCDAIDGARVHCFENERDLLVGFAADLRRIDPDILLGYNVFGFDMEYLYARSIELGCADHFSKLGRINGRNATFIKKMLSSGALGDNMLRFLRIEGRPCIDIMKVVQRDHKLDSFKLDSVAEHFLGDKKHDITPRDIFRMWMGSDQDRKVIAEYCIQDCALLNRLCTKLDILTNNLAMSNVCWVPLEWIFVRGQSAKIFSLMLQQCKEDGFLVPLVKYENKGDSDGGYEGAMVLTPEPAIHLENAIAVLDYASLYPSSMISENISHDTYVIDEQFANVPDVEYIDIMAEGKVCRFAQKPIGVLPRILKGLLDERKRTRKRIGWKQITTADGRIFAGAVSRKDGAVVIDGDTGRVVLAPEDVSTEADAFDNFQKAVLDGHQLALKVTANSLYGQMGARTSPVYMKELAACTTATGRAMITKAKDFVEQTYGAEVIYGDSVAEYTPLIVRVNGRVDVLRIDELADKYGSAWRGCLNNDKEYSEIRGVDTWTEKGWTSVQRVMRHALTFGKVMVRVCTGCSIVDVTSDHSLLRPNGMPVSPKQLRAGDELMHARVPPLAPIAGADVADAEAFWMFGQKDGISSEMLNSSDEVRRAMVKARFSNNRATTGDPTDACMMYMIAASTGQNVGVDWNNDGYVLALSHAAYKISEPKVRALVVIPYDGKVYDLTTNSAHFHAGVGTMVVHNTDSIFVQVPKVPGSPVVDEAMAFGARVSNEFKKLLKPPHDLEFEKVFWPFMIITKKRYAGNMYEDSSDHFKFKSMGICLRRRDSAAIVKTIYGGVLDIVLNNRDISAASAQLVDNLTKLVNGGYPLEELVITKSLRGSYKDPTRIAHKVLADRIAVRDPGNKPQSSDRIPYVYVKVEAEKGKKMLQGERIETPTYITENGLMPDYNFYVTNQIANPVTQIFGIVVEQLPGYNRAPDYWQRVQSRLVERDELSGDKLRDKIQELREAEAMSILINPILASIGEKVKRRLDPLR